MTQSNTESRFDASAVSPPSRSMIRQVALPLIILTTAAALILAVSWKQLVPATSVDAVAVVMRPVPVGHSTSGNQHSAHNMAGTVQSAGWIEPSPWTTFVVALEPGFVDQVDVLEGASVAAGNPIVRLNRANADINADAARGRVDMARALLEEAEDQLGRKELLLESGVVGEGEIVQLRARVSGLRAAKVVAEADRRSADLVRDRMTVFAPIDGVIMSLLVSPGSVVGGMEHLPHVAHMYDPTKLQVRADIPNADAASVSVGLLAEITSDTLPDRVFHGVVKRFVQQADLAKNTIQAKIEIIDPDPALRPDMLVRVKVFQMSESSPSSSTKMGGHDMIFAPSALLAGSGTSRTALVLSEVDQDRALAKSVVVEIGATRPDGWIEVMSGLKPGDALVDFRPHSSLADGSRVSFTLIAEPVGGAGQPLSTSSTTAPANSTHSPNGGSNGNH